MTWPFENDTHKIEKKVGKKKVFKQIAQETLLLLFQLF